MMLVHERRGHRVRFRSARLLLALALSSLLFLSAASAQDDGLPDDPAALREAIERFEQDSDYGEMILAAYELRDIAESRKDRIFALRSIGRGYGLLGDPERGVEAISDAVELASIDTEPQVLAQLYRDSAGMFGEFGQYEQSLNFIDRGLEVLGDVDAPELRSSLLVMRASVLGALGELDEALDSIRNALDLPLATPRQEIMRENNLGMILKWRGEMDAALDRFEQVYDAAVATESEQLIVYALLELGDVSRLLERYEDARRFLDEALERSRTAEKPRWQFFAHGYLAELEAALGREAAAEGHRQRATELQASLALEADENRARVLEVSLEVLERERRIERLQMQSQLQEARLQRNRTLTAAIIVIALLLLVALWLVMRQSQVRARTNRKLDQLANTDTLTGLHNRRYFTEHLKDRVARSEADGALILIDLDRFKIVNDEHGHDYGDQVLIEVAKRIQSMLRSEDTLARWGGEEFLAFLPGCGHDAAMQVAERIRAAIHQPPVAHDGIRHAVTATLGVACIDDDHDVRAAFRRADAALYSGKADGRNCVRFSNEEAPPRD